NPVTNKIYVANASSANVTVIDGATNTTATVAVGASPTDVAVIPATNKVYVANFGSANVTVIDGATNTTTTVAAGSAPSAIAVNPVTNKIYVANASSANVTVIDGATNTTTTVAVGANPFGVGVNPVTNKIYVTNFSSSNVTVIDGVSNTTTTVAVGANPLAVTVNPVTNKIYVANQGSNNVTVIDGATNTTANVAAGTSPRAVIVNPVTNKVYTANNGGANVTVITPSADTTLPLTTAITSSSMLSGFGNATTSTTPVFTFTAASTYSPTAPAIRTVYYRLNGGAWTQATGTGPFTATLAAVAKGSHVLQAFAVDSLEGGATAGSSGNGSGSSAIVGSVATYPFTLVDPVAPGAPTIGTATGGNTQATVTFTAPASDGGSPITTYTATSNPSNLTGSCTAPCTSITVTGLTNGTAYTFTVTATNAIGTSTASAASNSVTPRATQTITFNPPSSVNFGTAPITLTATGGVSGNPVTFASQTPSVCTTSGSNGATLTFVATGTCTVRASQAGNASFLAAADVDRNITIVNAPPPPPPTLDASNVACIIRPGGTVRCTVTGSTSGSNGTPTAAITGYQVYCRDTSAGFTFNQTYTGGNFTLPALPLGQIYSCQVTATSSSGPSNPVNLQLAPQNIPLALRGQFDVDGRGFASILLRGVLPGTTETDGTVKAGAAAMQVGRWDGAKFVFTTITDVGVDWAVLGVGDVTGTGTSSLISRNLASNVRIDLTMPPVNGSVVRNAKSDWIVEAVSDLDGDGKADILWRYIKPGTDDSGVTFAWFMGGSETTVNVNEVKHRGGAPLSWNLVGAIDLDGDQRGDIVWVSPTGQIRALMGQAGRTWVNRLVGQLPAGYSIMKLGDVDGDGKGDIVLRDTEGNVKVWLMDGVIVKREWDLPTTDKRWQFYAAGDFDGNGTMDLVWVRPDGTLVAWLINPTNV
ncbi:MAG: fibronectin type III domain-containing protein, partial [Cutibacterium sp.]|nr:fibronectin type III domain-containing protein [Cutibacterium sp.]